MIDDIAGVIGRDVSRETFDRLEQFVALLVSENSQQNLLASNDVPNIWNRHILDGAQLLALGKPGSWCDIGSGPGLPGVVIAILGGVPMTLVEPRRRRVDFLHKALQFIDLAEVTIEPRKVELLSGTFDNITARAVARLPKLFAMAAHLTHDGTKWVLPKGESVKSELDDARATWQGRFELVASKTNERAAIVVAEQVRRRGRP